MDNRDENDIAALESPYTDSENHNVKDFETEDNFSISDPASPFLNSELLFDQELEEESKEDDLDEEDNSEEDSGEPEYNLATEDGFEIDDRNYEAEMDEELKEVDGSYTELFIEEEYDDDFLNLKDEEIREELGQENLVFEEDKFLDESELFDAYEVIEQDHESINNLKQADEGLSSLALQAEKTWDAKDRPKKWIGQVYGLVVHTTGGSLPGHAINCDIYPTVYAMNHYTGKKKKNNCEFDHKAKSPGGCHYINGWQGIQGGDLLQIANERERAWGVSVKQQRESINKGSFEKDLPTLLVRHWKDRWPGYKHSLALLPKGEKYVNSCYIHVECLPVYYYLDGKSVISTKYPPMRPGLRFTKAQHDTVAYLACDIAIRNGWPLTDEWWRTSRLLGHEDLTPITRNHKYGGWDPGYLRDKVYFDWDYVYSKIEQIRSTGYKIPGQNVSSGGLDSLGDIIHKGKDVLSTVLSSGKLMGIAVSMISGGESDENKITNAVFYAKYPLKKGQKLSKTNPLAKEWIKIRNLLVRPLLRGSKDLATKRQSIRQDTLGGDSSKDNALGQPSSSKVAFDDPSTENLKTIPDSLGILTVDTSISELSKSKPTYKFTKEDALWLARFVSGEAKIQDNIGGYAVIWAMFNRFGMLRHKVSAWSSFQKYLRLYSTTLQPILKNPMAAERVWRNHKKNPKRFPVVLGDGTYPGTTIKKVQYKKHVDLQNRKWEEIPATIRRMVIHILQGTIPNPGIGIATEFASTRVYYIQRYGHEPSEQQWRNYTINYAKNSCKKDFKGCTWIGHLENLDQMENAFFIDNRFLNVPPEAIKVIP